MRSVIFGGSLRQSNAHVSALTHVFLKIDEILDNEKMGLN